MKNKKISKEKIILIIGIVLIIASVITVVPVYVRGKYCEKNLEGEVKTMFIIGPPGMDCPASNQTGDLNNDGCVNTIDLSILTEHWLTGCGGGGKPPCGSTDCGCIHSDLTGDGCVNADDFAVLAAHWGECPSFGS